MSQPSDRRTATITDPRNAGKVVFAFLGTQTLGDFVMQHLVAASVVRSFPGGRLVVIYRDDRPYKAFCNDLNPFVSKVIRLPENAQVIAPLDGFSGLPESATTLFSTEDIATGLHRPDVFLVPSMLDIGGTIPPAPQLQVPEKRCGELSERLIQRGLAPNQWFVCLHIRESGYRWRRDTDTDRSVMPTDYLPMMFDIVREQGGKVVRLGDPSMTPFPLEDGVIDLARADAPFEEQAFAVSRARYFIGTDSGPTQLACAFKVPTATTNAFLATVWNDHDVALLKKFRLPSGQILERSELLEMGIAARHGYRPQGVEIIDNAPDELTAVARHLHDLTQGCNGWREDDAEPSPIQPDNIELPLRWRGFDQMAAIDFWT